MNVQLFCMLALFSADSAVDSGSQEMRAETIIRGQNETFETPTYDEVPPVGQLNQAPIYGSPYGDPFLPGAVSPYGAGPLPFSQSTAGVYPLNPYGTRFGLRHFAGEGVGNRDGFTTFELFQPFWQGSSAMWFFDGRLFVDNDSSTGGNIGGGYRYYDQWMNRLWGASLWYDVDGTHQETFHQLGISLESLGPLFDARVNVYIPVGDTEETVGFSTPIARFDPGNLILLDVTRFSETALTGIDLEAGTPIPGLGPNVRMFGGYYHFENDSDGAPTIDGVSGRVEGWVGPNFSLQLKVTHDDTFDTNVTFGVSLFFGGSTVPQRGGNLPYYGTIRGQSPYLAAPPQSNRFYDSFQRNYNVVVATGSIADTLIAINPKTGLPWNVVHVDSNAGSGVGTNANPFMTLAAAQAGSSMNDIVFVHADSVFVGESFTMKSMQRLLGEGIDHTFDELHFGTVLLPRATAGTNLPLIIGSTGDAVTLAANTEVSGFSIISPGGSGILGDTITGSVNVNRNNILDAADDGVRLNDITGSVAITGNTISDSMAGDGIDVDMITGNVTVTGNDITGSSADGTNLNDVTGDVNFSNNTINGSGSDGAEFDMIDGSVLFAGNVIRNSGNDGVNIDDVTGQVRFLNNEITDSTARGVALGQTMPIGGAVTFSQNTITSSGGDGVRLFDINSGVSFTNNTISTSGGEGVMFEDIDGTVAFNNNTISGSGNDGVHLGLTRVTGAVEFMNNTISGSGDDGVQFNTIEDAIAFIGNTISGSTDNGAEFVTIMGDVNFSNNVINTSGGNGALLDDVDGAVTFDSNIIGASTGHGVWLGMTQVTGLLAFTNNTISGSGGHGAFLDDINSDVTFSGNTISGSAVDGAHLNDIDGTVAFDSNTISGSGGDGAHLGATVITGAVSFTNNTISGSGANGAFLDDIDDDVTVSGNTISSSTTNGALLNDIDGNVTFASNTISDSTVNGAWIGMTGVSGTVDFTDNTIIDSVTGDGALLEKITGNINFTGNDILLSGANGVRVTEIDGNLTIANNTITEFGAGAALAGINVINVVTTGDAFIISDNMIVDTAGDGIGINFETNGFAVNPLTIVRNDIQLNPLDTTIGIQLNGVNAGDDITLDPATPTAADNNTVVANDPFDVPAGNMATFTGDIRINNVNISP